MFINLCLHSYSGLHETILHGDPICYNFVITLSPVVVCSSYESINFSASNFRGTKVSGIPRVTNGDLMAWAHYE